MVNQPSYKELTTLGLMSSGSYTISYSNPPASGQDLVLQTAPAVIGAQNNNFSVSQTFSAGIVDSGNLTVAGTSTFTGKATFVAAPEFLSGITVDIGEADVGYLTVSGASNLNGGLTVVGAVALPAASVADSALSANVDLLNAVQTISAVKTFSAAPVLSGASITSSTIPAASIVSASLTNTQIAPGGVGQASVSNGYADLLSAQTVAGVKTFSSAPVMSGASVSAGTLPASSIVSSSITNSQIATAGISQASIASGYVDLLNAQTIAGVKSFSSAPVMSGASVTAGTLPSSSIVSSSITNTQIAAAGISQGSIASGYVDLVNAQIVAGQKSFTGAATFQSGLTCNAGALVNGGTLSCGQISCTGVSNTGSVSCTSVSASSSVSCTTLTPSGLLTANGGITIPAGQTLNIGGNLIGPSTQTVVTPVGGVSTVPLGGFSNAEFTITLSQTMTGLAFTNPAANTEFDIFVTVGAVGVNINKALSNGGITIYNTLAGNQAAANNSRWWFRGKFISLTVCYMDIINVT